MARERKGAIVEKFVHDTTKREAVIRLDKGPMIFFTQIEGAGGIIERFEDKDGRVVREWLRKELAHTTDAMDMTWLPVIEVRVSDGDRYGRGRGDDERASEKIDLEIDRYYIATTPNKQEWRKLKWAEADPASATKIEDGLMYAQSDRFKNGPKWKPVASDYYGRNDKPFVLPSMGDGGRSYVEYTPELWAGLQHVLATLKHARTEIEKLIATKQGFARLTAIGNGTQQLQIAERSSAT